MAHSFPTRRSSDLRNAAKSSASAESIGCLRASIHRAARGTRHERQVGGRSNRCPDHPECGAEASYIEEPACSRSDRIEGPVPSDRAAIVSRGLSRVIAQRRSEEHTSELQSLMRISYAVFCLKKKKEQKYKR